jgi:hypothetical protein
MAIPQYDTFLSAADIYTPRPFEVGDAFTRLT